MFPAQFPSQSSPQASGFAPVGVLKQKRETQAAVIAIVMAIHRRAGAIGPIPSGGVDLSKRGWLSPGRQWTTKSSHRPGQLSISDFTPPSD